MHQRLVVAAFAAVLSTVAVRGQQIIAQNAGLPNPATVVDFGANVLPNFTPVSTQFTGLTITHASYFTTGVVNNLVGGFLTNDFSAGAPNTLRIQMATPVTDLSFVYHQISTTGPSVIRILLQGVQVDSFSGTWNQSQPNNYFGFQNTLCDELQIDFQSDFNFDTLAMNPTGLADCSFANGTGLNAIGFSCTTLPVLGTTWQGAVTTNANTLLTALAYAPADLLPSPVPLFGGELLVQPAGLVLFTGFSSYALAIPAASSWIGTELAFQALRVDSVAGNATIVPLNAMVLELGL